MFWVTKQKTAAECFVQTCFLCWSWVFRSGISHPAEKQRLRRHQSLLILRDLDFHRVQGPEGRGLSERTGNLMKLDKDDCWEKLCFFCVFVWKSCRTMSVSRKQVNVVVVLVYSLVRIRIRIGKISHFNRHFKHTQNLVCLLFVVFCHKSNLFEVIFF